MSSFLKGLDYKKLVVYGTAFLVYTAYTGWLLVGYEKFVCDLATEDVIQLRLMSGIPRALLGFVCGILESAIERRMGALPRFWRQAVAGSLSLFAFQLPLYVMSALIMRIGTEQILITCGIYIAIDMIFGWSYAILLDRMRRWFGVVAEEQS